MRLPASLRSKHLLPFPAIPELLEPRLLWSGGSVSIDGVQPASLDQPQIHAILRTSTTSAPLVGQNLLGDPTNDIQGFLDTGTSGVLLSSDAAASFGVNETTYRGKPVDYSDSGVAGSESFGVSSPLTVSLAAFNGNNDTNSGGDPPVISAYDQTTPNIRLQISRAPVDELIGPLNIFGMPLLQNKTVVMDTTPVNSFNAISTYVYTPGTKFNPLTADTNPGIPTTNFHVKLSYGSFNQFASVTPAGAPGPIEVANPFIGPNPVLKLMKNPPADTTPPVTLTQGSLSSTGSFLFDTGAAASFISTAEAGKLGIHYKPGTYDTDNPVLLDAKGAVVPNQFVIPLGGIGGTLNAAGYFVDSMTLPTTEGVGVRFLHAPLLVADVSVTDPVTHQSLTLDGDFGMNFLVASTDLALSNSNEGPFNWVTYDQKAGLLGLNLPGAVITPAPTAVATLPAFANGSSSYTFSVKYTAPAKQTITAATITGNNIRVTGPNGYSKLATLVSRSSSTDSAVITATYKIAPPDGFWDAADNGAYTLSMQANQVSDTNKDAVVAGSLGTITLKAPSAVVTSTGQLIVDGTAGNNTITVTTASGSVTVIVDGVKQTFSRAAIKTLSVLGLAGNDTITVNTGLPAAVINGGTGNDTIFAKNAVKDSINGGGGTDVATVDLVDVVVNVLTIKH